MMMFIRGTSCPPDGSDESVKSVIKIFNIRGFRVFRGLSFFHGGHGWTRRGINENENDRSQEVVLCPQADGLVNANYVNARELT